LKSVQKSTVDLRSVSRQSPWHQTSVPPFSLTFWPMGVLFTTPLVHLPACYLLQALMLLPPIRESVA
jgi:hypothetical protein